MNRSTTKHGFVCKLARSGRKPPAHADVLECVDAT